MESGLGRRGWASAGILQHVPRCADLSFLHSALAFFITVKTRLQHEMYEIHSSTLGHLVAPCRNLALRMTCQTHIDLLPRTSSAQKSLRNGDIMISQHYSCCTGRATGGFDRSRAEMASTSLTRTVMLTSALAERCTYCPAYYCLLRDMINR
jgi:hypothetical protein